MLVTIDLFKMLISTLLNNTRVPVPFDLGIRKIKHLRGISLNSRRSGGSMIWFPEHDLIRLLSAEKVD
jgi:hypothetical protein